MKKILTIIILVAVIIFAYVSFEKGKNSEISELDKEHWSTSIEKNGALSTYEEFKEFNNSLPVSKQHLETHIIGELLYDHEGVKGIVVCDSSFAFGCYHGFFGTALASEGVDIVPKLDQICVSEYGPLGGGCQHGIGHGIIEYIGYDNLSEALEICKKTSQISTTIGCTSGVFMEYNLPLVFSDKNVRTEPLPFDQQNPYGACTEIEKEFQPSCYYELAQWWTTALNEDHEKIGTLCEGVLDDNNRKYCSIGVGSMIAISTRFNVEEIINKCSKVSKSEELMCRAGATWSFFADPAHKEEEHEICDGLEYNEQEICIKEADLTEGLDSLYESYFE